MFKIALFSILITCLPGQGWHYNMQEAEQIAKKEHFHILLNFSGSDWCGPCILLRKEILDQPAFLQMADTSLVLVNADFPRKKKNQLAPGQQHLNDQMADQYNPKGQFPLTLLLNADGKVLAQWEGDPGVKAEVFSRQIRKLIDADR
jgi:thioredoxin-related protein